ncbi:hypothetical protein DFH09DRAFT_1355041 [Mycena vulgaris]|nr:hypothetical protein DFH09DRAFT_1355041 [Mycena vulgaris]
MLSILSPCSSYQRLELVAELQSVERDELPALGSARRRRRRFSGATSHYDFIHALVRSPALASRVEMPRRPLYSMHSRWTSSRRVDDARAGFRRRPLSLLQAISTPSSALDAYRLLAILVRSLSFTARPHPGNDVAPLLLHHEPRRQIPIVACSFDHCSARRPSPCLRITKITLLMSCGGCGNKIVPRDRRSGARLAGPACVLCVVLWAEAARRLLGFADATGGGLAKPEGLRVRGGSARTAQVHARCYPTTNAKNVSSLAALDVLPGLYFDLTPPGRSRASTNYTLRLSADIATPSEVNSESGSNARPRTGGDECRA